MKILQDSNNLPYFIGAAIFSLAAIYWLLPFSTRKYLILFASMVAVVSIDRVYAGLLSGIAAITYLAVVFILRSSDRNGAIIFKSIVCLLVALLVGAKVLIGQNWQSPIFLALGMSYVVFRLIHYVTLAYRKELQVLSFMDLLTHTFFFPSLVAGPVLRYQAWCIQKIPKKMEIPKLNSALLRIITGITKKFILSDQINKFVVMPVFDMPSDYAGWIVAGTVCLDFLRIFLDFSGYSDIAIGTARLFGYELPENFDYPLLQSNVADFWRKWHISLHDFIRDHVFIPFFGYRPTNFKIYLGLFVTMSVMMLWHAFSWGFFWMGVLHGFAMMLWHFVQVQKRQLPRLAGFFNSQTGSLLSVLMTFLLCSFTAPLGFRGLDKALLIYYEIFW